MKYIFKMPGLHPLQEEVVHDTTRFKILCCGRRWGKTKMCAAIAVQKALDGKRVWWMAPNYETTDLGWREVIALVHQLPFQCREKASSPKEIHFPNGGFIKFRSADSFARGEGLDYLIVDEADFIDGEGDIGAKNSGKIWNEILRPSLMDRKGSAIFITTPNIENGWIHRMFETGESGKDPQFKSWRFSSYTNPFLDSAEIDAMKVDMPSIVFRREVMAEFVSTAGARIRREWLTDRYLDNLTEDDLKGMWVSIGIDLAISTKTTADYTSYAVLARDVNGYVYVLDVQRARLTFKQQIDFLKQALARWNPQTVGVESVGYQEAMVEELSLGTNFTVLPVKVTKDKVTRFAAMEARYERREVYHLRGIPPEFESELFGFPNSEHDDQIDAISCAWAVLGIPTAIEDQIVESYTGCSMENFPTRTDLDAIIEENNDLINDVLDGW